MDAFLSKGSLNTEMKLGIFRCAADERKLLFTQTASRRNMQLVMAEKDFWVTWVLGVLFEHPEFRKELVFKGGTSLSKVFKVIARFSEDIDLSVSPACLGFDDTLIDAASSRRQAESRIKELETACISMVKERYVPELEGIATEALGQSANGRPWMEFSVDETTHSPVIAFHYPCVEPAGFEYLRRSVKMEFGSLTDQQPVGVHPVTSWVAEEFPEQLSDFKCNLVALELERTFWEKATILHMEHHREASKPMRDRFSRHYSDMAALSAHSVAEIAMKRIDLLERVAQWKGRFFPAAWARYDLAHRGSLRLAPPEFRVRELKQDYEAMKDMFIDDTIPFEQVLASVADLEERINKS